MDKTYENRFGYLIADVARLHGRLYDRRAKRLGLTRAQSRVLAYLTWKGEMNQARLAEWLEITPISLTRLLDRMASYGWIERIANDDDRRAFVIRLTDKSREIFPQMLEVGDTVADDGLRGFTQEERDTLVRLLGRVRRNLIECGGD
ncbi:MarR family winged helix-turn-helix transcriptional regulator [Burkholderia multivorans]|uniref:MarR family transcriptional regulator n=1 Tax=Burkholderia multivorans (strain ATCC 17616 / 249) TaxID=395019 RepID=A0A0H3KKZ0_BURM1|nr:MarR family transcriptional regulator [Burkholderia multivorans]ABX18143.1 transcriptional regulator, MarR family [Burkholderia multivorans ATCC 17616]MBU9518213.1 MarR family transcriptional regulator [Burkholderia multivorans]MBU9559419.1 MarR family transcriptional regulator [Burkholderia multivorans]PRF51278.1 MarR family transcriptional regulator [Burkholderia multivorans]BAG45905.1 MarR family transcriptional regulator [Burkholderia multivorans ATCC 17616]